MLRIEILKFRAQDIITSSAAGSETAPMVDSEKDSAEDPVCRCSSNCQELGPGAIIHDKPGTCSCELPPDAVHDKIIVSDFH